MSAVDSTSHGQPIYEVRGKDIVSIQSGRKLELKNVKDTSNENLQKICNLFNNCPKLPNKSTNPLSAMQGHAKPLPTRPSKPLPETPSSRATKAAEGTNKTFERTPLEGKRASLGDDYDEDADTEELPMLELENDATGEIETVKEPVVEKRDYGSGSEEGLPETPGRKAPADRPPPPPTAAPGVPTKKSASDTDVRPPGWKSVRSTEAQTWSGGVKVGTRRAIPDFGNRSATPPGVSGAVRSAPVSDSPKPDSPHSKTLQALKEFNGYMGTAPKLLKVVTLDTGEQCLQFTEVKESKLKSTLRGLFGGFSKEFNADQVISVFNKVWSEASNSPHTSVEDATTLATFCKNIQKKPADDADLRVANQRSELGEHIGGQVTDKSINPKGLLDNALKAATNDITLLVGKLKNTPSEQKPVIMGQLQEKFKQIGYSVSPTESSPAENTKAINARSEFVAELIKKHGFEVMKDFAIFLFDSETSEILKNDAGKGAFQSEFRGTSVASTIYRGLVTAEFPALRDGGALMTQLTTIMSNKTTTGTQKADLMMDAMIGSFQNGSDNFKALHREMQGPFTKLYSLRGENARTDARTLASSMPLLRFINPFVAEQSQKLKDATVMQASQLVQYAANAKLLKEKPVVAGNEQSVKDSELRKQENEFLQSTLFAKAQKLQQTLL